MEDQNFNEEPRPEIQEEQSPFFIKHLFLIITVSILLIILAILTALLFRSSPSPEVQEPEAVEKETSYEVVDGNFFFPPGNFEFTVEEEWALVEQVERKPIDLLAEDDFEFTFSKKDTKCIFAYGLISQPQEYPYKQTSFAERVFTLDNHQIDSSWYVHNKFRPDGLEFKWEGEQPIDREIRFMPYPFSQGTILDRSYAFALYASDGGAVLRSCDREVSQMLSSLSRNYRQLNAEPSSGIGYIIRYDKPNKLTNKLMFMPLGSEEGFSVEEMAVSTIVKPFITKEAIYFLEGGRLKKFDWKSQEVKRVTGVKYGENNYINDFKIIDDYVYYLLGQDCNEYRARCDNDLYRLRLHSNEPELLSEHSTSRRILGLAPDRDLYLMYADGDAGCIWRSVEQYDFNASQLVSIDEYGGGCSGDEGWETTQREFNMFRDALYPQFQTTDYFIVENNRLFVSPEDLSTVDRREGMFYVESDL